MKHIRVLADYDCWPTWAGDDLHLEHNLDPHDLGLPPDLADALVTWSDEFDATLVRDDPASSAFPSPEAETAWNTRGRALASQVAHALPGSAVRYHDRALQHDVPA